MYRSFCLLLLLVLATSVNGMDRIINGENATIENFPYQVSLRDLDGNHLCGGSILSSRIVLTAAHCVPGNVGNYSIRYGSTFRNDGKKIEIARIDLHEDYQKPVFVNNDIAVIYLAEDIEFGPGAQPIALASKSPDPLTDAVVSGWGLFKDSTFDFQFPNQLQKLNVQIVDRSKCGKIYFNLTKSMLCAGADVPSGACSRDSGGPLVANNELVGVVSFTKHNCAPPFTPDVYADVANLRKWIDRKITQY